MSIEAMIWVRKHAPVNNATEMCILYSLADRANDDGTGCWPSNETIADEARCSERTVQRNMKELASRGLIVPGDERLVASYRPDRRPNVWNLNMSLRRDDTGCQNDTPNKSGVSSGAERGDNGGNHGVTSSAERGDTDVTQTILNPPMEPPLNLPPLVPQGGAAEASQEIELAQPKAKPVSKKGTRITPDWMPSQPVIDKMQAQFPDMDFFAVHEEFIDYWLGVPGQRGVKLDWDATWRNSIRRSGNRGDYPRARGQVSTSRPGSGRSKADSKALWYAQKAEELARKYAGGDSGAY